MPPAARIGDMHTCPMSTPGLPPVPHVGGPILPPGLPTVLIGGMPAATVGSLCVCVGPPDSIVTGSFSVLIGGKPAARMGDTTAHGGVITVGLPTVLIGPSPVLSPSGSPPACNTPACPVTLEDGETPDGFREYVSGSRFNKIKRRIGQWLFHGDNRTILEDCNPAGGPNPQQECCYDADGNLIPECGTSNLYDGDTNPIEHIEHDIIPFLQDQLP